MSEFIDELTQRVKETIDVVSKKADEVITIQGLKSQKRNAKRAIKNEYAELGKLVFARYQKGEALDEEAMAHCEQINDQMNFIEQIDEDIINIQLKDDIDLDEDFDDEDDVDESDPESEECSDGCEDEESEAEEVESSEETDKESENA